MNPLYRNIQWLYKRYIVDDLTARQIADECHVGQTAICTWLKRLNIPVKGFDLDAKRKEHAEYMKQYHRKHPEKNRENVRRWRKAKPFGINRKPERRNQTTERKEIIVNFLSERDGWNCFYCGEEIDWETVTIDHVISPLLGGEQRMDNLRLAHKSCNILAGLGVRREIYGY